MTEATEVDTTRKPIWGVLLAAAIGCVMLVGLGTWQLQRLHWKEGLIARIEARTKASPIDLAAAVRQWQETGDVEYLHVRAQGRFEGQDNFYFIAGDAGAGYHVYTPLRTATGDVLIVNRGFIADTRLPAEGQSYSRPAGEVTVTGLVRASEALTWFSGAAPHPGATRPWLTRDLKGMADRTGLAGLTDGGKLVPFFLDLDRTGASSDPQGGTTRLEIPNRHLEYALTWYGLAVTLVVMTGLFIASRRRQI
ncbi:MAG: SURF1 family protein [Hyphomicrobiaceae bacterium]